MVGGFFLVFVVDLKLSVFVGHGGLVVTALLFALGGFNVLDGTGGTLFRTGENPRLVRAFVDFIFSNFICYIEWSDGGG